MNSEAPAPPRAYAGILLASMGILMLEILLTRIFSFTVWYRDPCHHQHGAVGLRCGGLDPYPRLIQNGVARLAGCSGLTGARYEFRATKSLTTSARTSPLSS